MAGARRRRPFVLSVVLGLLLAVLGVTCLARRSGVDALTPKRARALGISHLPSGSREIVSEYSRIRIEERGTVRRLLFVSDDGATALESEMDVTRPQDLLIRYTQAMFASYFFLPRQERVLIVGLGAGSMVRFLEHHDPQLRVDVVEIDPVIVEVAREHFGTRASANVRIFVQDGFDYLKSTSTIYDVVYMDAFLKPAEDTDASGIPLRLKTKAFLRELQGRVHPNGLIVFNVHEPDDLLVIRDVFEETYVFRLEVSGSVAVGASASGRFSKEELLRAGRELDARFQASFSFAEIAERLAPAI